MNELTSTEINVALNKARDHAAEASLAVHRAQGALKAAHIEARERNAIVRLYEDDLREALAREREA